MKGRIEKLIKHLKTQLEVADSLQSDWVYITKNEAKKCLELAEAEDTIIDSDPVEHAKEVLLQNGWEILKFPKDTIGKWGDR